MMNSTRNLNFNTWSPVLGSAISAKNLTELDFDTSGKSKKFLVWLMTTYSDLINILSKIKQNFDKEEPTCHK